VRFAGGERGFQRHGLKKVVNKFFKKICPGNSGKKKEKRGKRKRKKREEQGKDFRDANKQKKTGCIWITRA